MSVQSFGYTILDTNVKSLTSFGSIEAQGNIVLNAYDSTQPNGKAAGNAGKNAFIAIGNNTNNNPLYIVGSDTQLTAGQPNKGKCSIVPNVGAVNHQYDGHETMGIGYDSTNKQTPMPAGAWIRSAAGVDGFNCCFSLSNVDNTTAGGGIYYTHELTRVGQPNNNDYNLYLNNSAAVSQNVLNIHPTTSTTTDFTINATRIFLNGIISSNGTPLHITPVAGSVILPVSQQSIIVNTANGGAGLTGVVATSIIMITQASPNTGGTDVALPLYVVAGVNEFTIIADITITTAITINWSVVKY